MSVVLIAILSLVTKGVFGVGMVFLYGEFKSCKD